MKNESRRAEVASLLLVAHVALISFATLAMVTLLAGEFPTWMQGPYTPRVFELSWRYTGQAYVLLGLLAVLCHAGPRFGWGRSILLFTSASLVALSSELLGTNFGVPFGAYHYTNMLGFRVNGDVPYVIPLSWSYMLYACLAMCGRMFRTDGRERPWTWALAAGVMLTAWDIPLEVHMTNVSPVHWVWDMAAMPAWIPSFLTRGVFYGMPLTNWIGWILTATLVARLMLAIVPAATWRRTVSPFSFPLVLYAANGLMPIATTARHGLWGATVLGIIAMGLPLGLALLHPAADTSRSEVAPAAVGGLDRVASVS